MTITKQRFNQAHANAILRFLQGRSFLSPERASRTTSDYVRAFRVTQVSLDSYETTIAIHDGHGGIIINDTPYTKTTTQFQKSIRLVCDAHNVPYRSLGVKTFGWSVQARELWHAAVCHRNSEDPYAYRFGMYGLELVGRRVQLSSNPTIMTRIVAQDNERGTVVCADGEEYPIADRNVTWMLLNEESKSPRQARWTVHMDILERYRIPRDYQF